MAKQKKEMNARKTVRSISKPKMKVKRIHQTVHFRVPAAKIYSVLMDAKKHAALTGDKAIVSPKKGGMFVVFGGWAHGVNLRLNKNKDIVQTWIASDWPHHHTSYVHFHFFPEKQGKETRLEFVHQHVPTFAAKDIAKGWHEFYWKPLKAMLEK
jgi:activator of HSP90 ATPase